MKKFLFSLFFVAFCGFLMAKADVQSGLDCDQIEIDTYYELIDRGFSPQDAANGSAGAYFGCIASGGHSNRTVIIKG